MESNVQKMTATLMKVHELLMLRGNGNAYCVLSWGEFNYLAKKCREALALPLRNCDVGTAEEQAKRCFAYCNQHSCKFCPANTIGRCTLIWSQMPYKESEASK